MAEYITKEQAINALLLKGQKSTRYKLGETWELNLFEIQEVINAMPAADVQLIRRGRWKLTNNPSFRKCSECGAWWGSDIADNYFTNYCPKCGADMRDVPDTDVGEIANVVEFKKRMERE